MADIKISELLPATTVSDTDIVVINQGNITKTATRALIRGTQNPGTVTSITAGAGLSGGTITGSGTIALTSPVAVTNGGTGVTASTGANSVVLRDANQNITANAYFNNLSSITASAVPVVLTVASAPVILVTNVSPYVAGQAIKLPDATTLSLGTVFSFNNNQSQGAITVTNGSIANTLVVSVPVGAYTTVVLKTNSNAAGTWDIHDQIPSNASWSTNTLDWNGSITSATWNGDTVEVNRGGTGVQTLSGLVKGNGTSAFTAATAGTDYVTPSGNITGTAANVTGTVAIANGGTGAITAPLALAALGGAASGANTDITSVALTAASTSTATPTNANDIVNKSYADSIGSGINFHDACNYATIAALPAYTYNNGTAGVGASITATSVGPLSIDGTAVAVTTPRQRVLIKDETSTNRPYNGVYTVERAGGVSETFQLVRATDYDTSGSGTNEIQAGDFVLILDGGSLANTAWVQQTKLPITVGTTNISFTQFAAAAPGVTSLATTVGGLSVNQSTGAVSLGGTVSIAGGGTGQTTAEAAQIALKQQVWQVSARSTGSLNPTTATATKLTYPVGSGIGGILFFDNYPLLQGDTVFLFNQSTLSQNGPWIITTIGTASIAAVLDRPAYFLTGTARHGMLFQVQRGTTYTGQIIGITGGTANAAITIGTTSIIPSIIANTGSTVAVAIKSTNISGGNDTTLLGSMPYQTSTDITTLLAPNITTIPKYLRQTGTGTAGAAPLWDQITVSDVSGAAASGANNDIDSVALLSGTISNAPSTSDGIANKDYVDTSVRQAVHLPVDYATTAALPSSTYANGIAGAGATLTANATGPLVIDGVTMTSTDIRVLIKDQASAIQNGIYIISAPGGVGAFWQLYRATDFDSAAKILGAATVPVALGTSIPDTIWANQINNPLIGFTDITFALSVGVIPVSRGGTGATTAATALTNLGGVKTADIQVFTAATNTWTKPVGAKSVNIQLFGGGGGGGSGRKDATAATGKGGGGGGAGGSYLSITVPASIFSATENVAVGLGGAGAAGITAASTNGISASSAGNSSMTVGGVVYFIATGGGGGLGGSISAGNGGVAVLNANNGGASSITGTASAGSPSQSGSSTVYGGAGGGGGGGITTASAATSGGTGGRSNVLNFAGGAAGAAGTAGTVGTNNSLASTGLFAVGSGGGGGGGGVAVSGGAGGAGGFPAGGGGGGGATETGTTSGAGGAGAAGLAIITTYF